MKKIVICGFLVLIFMVCFGFSDRFFSQKESIVKSGVYLKEASSLANATNYGFIKEATLCGAERAQCYYKDCSVVGEFFVADKKTFNLDLFAQNMGLMVLRKTSLENSQNIYCYSALSPYKIKGQDFNVQISITKNKVFVATPIIFGSF